MSMLVTLLPPVDNLEGVACGKFSALLNAATSHCSFMHKAYPHEVRCIGAKGTSQRTALLSSVSSDTETPF